MDNIVMHKFSVGQTVNLIPRVLRSAAAGEYEIRHLMPAPDTDPDKNRILSVVSFTLGQAKPHSPSHPKISSRPRTLRYSSWACGRAGPAAERTVCASGN
jgi:hypothetical protein